MQRGSGNGNRPPFHNRNSHTTSSSSRNQQRAAFRPSRRPHRTRGLRRGQGRYYRRARRRSRMRSRRGGRLRPYRRNRGMLHRPPRGPFRSTRSRFTRLPLAGRKTRFRPRRLQSQELHECQNPSCCNQVRKAHHKLCKECYVAETYGQQECQNASCRNQVRKAHHKLCKECYIAETYDQRECQNASCHNQVSGPRYKLCKACYFAETPSKKRQHRVRRNRGPSVPSVPTRITSRAALLPCAQDGSAGFEGSFQVDSVTIERDFFRSRSLFQRHLLTVARDIGVRVVVRPLRNVTGNDGANDLMVYVLSNSKKRIERFFQEYMRRVNDRVTRKMMVSVYSVEFWNDRRLRDEPIFKLRTYVGHRLPRQKASDLFVLTLKKGVSFRQEEVSDLVENRHACQLLEGTLERLLVSKSQKTKKSGLSLYIRCVLGFHYVRAIGERKKLWSGISPSYVRQQNALCLNERDLDFFFTPSAFVDDSFFEDQELDFVKEELIFMIKVSSGRSYGSSVTVYEFVLPSTAHSDWEIDSIVSEQTNEFVWNFFRPSRAPNLAGMRLQLRSRQEKEGDDLSLILSSRLSQEFGRGRIETLLNDANKLTQYLGDVFEDFVIPFARLKKRRVFKHRSSNFFVDALDVVQTDGFRRKEMTLWSDDLVSLGSSGVWQVEEVVSGCVKLCVFAEKLSRSVRTTCPISLAPRLVPNTSAHPVEKVVSVWPGYLCEDGRTFLFSCRGQGMNPTVSPFAYRLKLRSSSFQLTFPLLTHDCYVFLYHDALVLRYRNRPHCVCRTFSREFEFAEQFSSSLCFCIRDFENSDFEWVIDSICVGDSYQNCGVPLEMKDGQLSRPVVEILEGMDWKKRFEIQSLVDCGITHLMEMSADFLRSIESADLHSLRSFCQVCRSKRIPTSKMPAVLSNADLRESPMLDGEESAWVMSVLFFPNAVLCRGSFFERSSRFSRHCDSLCRVRFSQEFLSHPMDFQPTTTGRGAFARMKKRKTPEFMLRLVRNAMSGLTIAGRNFLPIGFTGSCIRNLTILFVPSFVDRIELIREVAGDQIREKSCSKFFSRLGLGFTASRDVLPLNLEEFEVIPDIERNCHCFTDGCGLIRHDYALKIAEALFLTFVPSAFQIRFLGFKGVLVVTLDASRKPVTFVESMKKCEWKYTDSASLEIVNYSRRIPAYFNRQISLVLEGIGLDRLFLIRQLEVFLGRIDFLKQDLAQLMRIFGNSVCTALLPAVLKFSRAQFARLIGSRLINTILSNLRTRHRIWDPDGVVLIGVADHWNVLGCGQIYVSYSMEGDDDPVVLEGDVLVTRNPCHFPSSIQRFTCVAPSELSHLRNVIVFSIRGTIPQEFLLSNGDLDGDLYWIHKLSEIDSQTVNVVEREAEVDACDLIQIGAFSSVPRPFSFDELTDYFVSFLCHNNLSHVSNLHLWWASRHGVADDHSIVLARKCQRSVDCAKHGVVEPLDDFDIPPFLTTYTISVAIGRPGSLVAEIQHRLMNVEPETDAFDVTAESPEEEPDWRGIDGYEEFIDVALESYLLFSSLMLSLLSRLEISSVWELVSSPCGYFNHSEFGTEFDMEFILRTSREIVFQRETDGSQVTTLRKKLASLFAVSQPEKNSGDGIAFLFPYLIGGLFWNSW